MVSASSKSECRCVSPHMCGPDWASFRTDLPYARFILQRANSFVLWNLTNAKHFSDPIMVVRARQYEKVQPQGSFSSRSILVFLNYGDEYTIQL